MKPIIAIIASSHLQFCDDFLRTCNLDQTMFKKVTQYWDVQGLPKDIPVIITNHRSTDNYYKLVEVLNHRFSNIRHMEY